MHLTAFFPEQPQ